MRISPHYTTEDWRRIDFSKEEGWQKAIDIFEDRIRGRFLDIIDRIQNQTYSGFAVLALDCLLIETLQQFREGVEQTPHGRSKEYFVRFLTESSFKEFFDEKKAKIFYDQIRCGILHQAEVKGSSRVIIREGTPLVSFTEDGKGLIINRRLFHSQLVKEFENYVSSLRCPTNSDLRERFRKKMEYICRVSATMGEE